tara:strand:- start:16 stop:648 length:633 start_codon:yes stop_codon:yes gene_type:complete
MTTIKLTGFNTATGRITTAGTTDDMVTDGSMTIGDDDTDTIIVNAEFDSDLIPDDNDTYDLGSASKKWRTGYFDQIHSKLRHVNTAKYTESSAEQRYVRWDAAGSNGSPGVNNKFIAPADGLLICVKIRATSASNSTAISFHKAGNGTENLNTTPTETQIVNMSVANIYYLAAFSSATFSAGDILGISLTPTVGFGNVNITCVWLFDWNS